MEINSQQIDTGADIFYNPKFRSVLESHLLYIKTHSTTRELILESYILYKYEFDFYSVLAYYNIPTYMHWVTLRLNELHSPQIFPSNLASILIPSREVLESIRQIYNTTAKLQY